mgnify:FL=1
MTVDKLAEMLNATTVNQADFSREIVGGYAGDLLSFVMGRAPENCAWYTVMTNVNVAAVAVLVDVSVVVLCEGCLPDPTLVERAKTQGINVIATTLPVYDAIAAVCCNED